MSQENFIIKMLGLQNILVSDIKETENSFNIYLFSKPQLTVCPHCGCITSTIHDYRTQIIKDIPYANKHIYLYLKKLRYHCSHCNKHFYEHYSFIPKYHRITNKVFTSIIHSCRDKLSFKDIAVKHNVSSSTVIRAFELVNHNNKPPLPEALGIDEFKGNTGYEKYQLILTDIANKKVNNILPTRKKTDIITYFKQYSVKERKKVKFFIMDMWNDYKNIAWLFPNAKIIVDKYHYVRQVYWALDRIRKKIQKNFPHDKRLHFKRSKKILWKEYDKLSDDNKIVVRLMLDQHEELYQAWMLKELFVSYRNSKTRAEAEKEMLEWLLTAEEINLPEFKDCIKAFHNWSEYINNSIEFNYTNGFTEGTNNKIKVIKRIAFGYRNFNHFRNRILLNCG